jgi:two-component system sensor histidine kinase KdpD
VTDEDRDELLATADESLDRLTHLVDNLLDMSRLQAGALAVFPRPAGLEEIVARALDDLGPAGRQVVVDIPVSLPEVRVDPAILERIIVNLTTNAVRYSPADQPPLLTASALGDRVELRVADRGPGIPEPERDRVFVPFQRLGDTDNTTGVGLGLALSRGLTEAMGGTLEPEETPGGGLTMVLSLPAAPVPEHPGRGAPGRRERDQDSSQPTPTDPAAPAAPAATAAPAAPAARPRRHPRPVPRVASWPRDPRPGRRRRAADPARAADQPAGARI